MVFRAVTLHMPAMKFVADNEPQPKSHRVGEKGCIGIDAVDGGLLVRGEGKSFWTPFANVVWAEPAAGSHPPSPSALSPTSKRKRR